MMTNLMRTALKWHPVIVWFLGNARVVRGIREREQSIPRLPGPVSPSSDSHSSFAQTAIPPSHHPTTISPHRFKLSLIPQWLDDIQAGAQDDKWNSRFVQQCKPRQMLFLAISFDLFEGRGIRIVSRVAMRWWLTESRKMRWTKHISPEILI